MKLGAPLGDELRAQRERLGVAVETVAECLGLTPEVVNRIEAGDEADQQSIWRLQALLAIEENRRAEQPHPLPLRLAVGALFRLERTRQQLTLKTVGQRIDRPARWVGQVERARIDPGYLIVHRLARDGLEVPPADLVEAAEYALGAILRAPLG